MSILDTLETGDVILFSGNSWISYIVEWFGRSPYSHVGMIIKNPSFINTTLQDGIYLLESGFNSIPDSEDHLYKVGVQIHLLSDILEKCQPGSVYVRRISCKRDSFFYEKLDNIHKTIHNRPYDMNLWDWLKASYHLDIDGDISIQQNEPQTTDRFWCSALIAYVFDKLDLIEPVNWTIVTPRDFSYSTRIHFRCEIGKEELIK